MIRLKIINVSFTSDINWVFELTDGKTSYYIFDSDFYRKNNIKNPISKKELDYLDIGYYLKCEVKRIDGFFVVTSIIE
jgi:hypothetical protein